jgi:GST-like protein
MIERTAPAAAYLGCHAHPPQADAAVLERIGSVDLRARWQQVTSGQFAAEQLEDSRSKIQQAAERIEVQLADRDWLMGAYSIADLESYAWLAGMVPLVPEPFSKAPRTLAWLARVKGSAPVATALSLARSAEPAASWSVGPEINRWG